jgi:Leucine-rich repeat (LRR) protein
MTTNSIAQLPSPLLAHVLSYLSDEWHLRRVNPSFKAASDLACREIVQDLTRNPQLEAIINRHLPPPRLCPSWTIYSYLFCSIRQIFVIRNTVFSLGIENQKCTPLLELIEKADAICSKRFVERLCEELKEQPPSEDQKQWVHTHAKRIIKLDLCTKICTVRKEIGLLTNLTYLNMSSTSLWEIPDLQQTSALKYLHLTNNTIATIPAWFSHLNHLHVLNLSNNPLQRLSFSAFPSGLRNLTISHCGQTHFPPIKNLKQLKMLDISKNKIRFIPRWIKNLNQLVSLNLSNNPIMLRKEIAQLTQLQSINLAYLKLYRLPYWMKYFTALEYINLNGNPFMLLPPALFYFTQLKELRMAYTQLRGIPSWIMHLQSLSIVDVSHTPLWCIPAHYFESLPHLVVLYI